MFVAGQPIDLAQRANWVGIIGSRQASQRERQAAFNLGAKLARRGDVVVSGLALGIDTEAHRGAISISGGFTIAIVNTMKDDPIYPPSNTGLAAKIRRQGCIIHPFVSPLDPYLTKPNHFIRRLLERDVLLAHLVRVVCVVSDTEPITGGSKWAAWHARELGKPIYRVDSLGKFNENPDIEKCQIDWMPEIDFQSFGGGGTKDACKSM